MEACKNDELALLLALKSSNHKAFEVLYYRYSLDFTVIYLT